MAINSVTGFTPVDFDRLGRAESEAAAVACLQAKVDVLLSKLNRSMAAARFLAIRRTMGLNAEEMFLTRGLYLHGDRGHWYVFHRGGRWEPQLNIGMHGTKLGGRRYVRVGV